jgi:hypothetical protein
MRTTDAEETFRFPAQEYRSLRIAKEARRLPANHVRAALAA